MPKTGMFPSHYYIIRDSGTTMRIKSDTVDTNQSIWSAEDMSKDENHIS